MTEKTIIDDNLIKDKINWIINSKLKIIKRTWIGMSVKFNNIHQQKQDLVNFIIELINDFFIATYKNINLEKYKDRFIFYTKSLLYIIDNNLKDS